MNKITATHNIDVSQKHCAEGKKEPYIKKYVSYVYMKLYKRQNY